MHGLKIVLLLLLYPLLFSTSIAIVVILTYFYNRCFHRHNIRRKPHLGRPLPPFSMDLKHASFPATSFSLSSIHIPHTWYIPSLQRMCKDIRFSQRNRIICKQRYRPINCRTFISLLLLPLFFFKHTQAVYHIPGTNHAIIKGETSSDTHR